MARTGWLAGPVRPESAVLPGRSDVGGLGPLTFALRWPRTHRLLTGEFQLSREQAWAVAWTARRHRGLRGGRLRLVARAAALGVAAAVPLVVLVAMPMLSVFQVSTVDGSADGLAAAWAAGVSAVLTLLVFAAWLGLERLGMDRLIDRTIRECWRDRVCVWCGQDMDEARPRGDRWAVCPECGMRSPVAVRSP